MSDDKRYNGWTNYETWNIALWLDNGGDEYWRERAQECFDGAERDSTFTKQERATLTLADEIHAQHDEQAEEWMGGQSGPFADLLNAALSEVNWHEIAEKFMDEIEQANETPAE